MELFMLFILSLILIGSTVSNIDVIWGLFLWLIFLIIYAVKRGCSFHDIMKNSIRQFSTVSNVLITFIFIGCLSSVLRECGCISCISGFFCSFSWGSFYLPSVFLICTLTSLCTGSAFAAAASSGIICLTVGLQANIPDYMLCGAIFSGIYVGDRISPVSSSCALVSEMTHVKIQDNISSMLKRFPLPFLLCLILYIILGFFYGNVQNQPVSIHYNSSLIVSIPAIIIFLLSILRVSSKKTLFFSILSGSLIALFYRHVTFFSLLRSFIWGYKKQSSDILTPAGGGIISMMRPAVIILIASCYIAIFEMSGFLDPVRIYIKKLPMSVSGKNILISLITGMISGSQTLTVILSSILLPESLLDKEKADILEDTSILIPAMIPWNIAHGLPAATLSASFLCIPFSFYLYLVPIFMLIKKTNQASS